MWLESCRQNPTIDFLIFTDDDTQYDYPTNVKVFYMDFQEMKEILQKQYDFPLNIQAPYKFCDFRPAFGEIFAEYLKDYEYWGHCDIDLIWGNIRKFITDDILRDYKRIFSRGHCSIYKNSLEVNAFYRSLPVCGCQDWKKVFQNEASCCYDEWAGHCGGGISQIMKLNSIEIYDEVCSADINVNYGKFQINRMPKYKDVYFQYENGKLELKSNDINKEVLCAHFQKRRLNIDENINYSNYYFVAPNYVTSEVSNIRSHFIEEKLFEIEKFTQRIQSKVRRTIMPKFL